MKTPCQRLLSLLLVFVLVLSLIPSVYAADNDESTPTEPEATETTASTESPTTTPPQSDPSEETEGSSAGAPDSQPDNEYGIATTASTSAGVLLFDYADHGNYTTVLNSQVSVTYKPNGTGSAKTAYIKNLGWHFARYNNIAYADDPLYCIEPYKTMPQVHPATLSTGMSHLPAAAAPPVQPHGIPCRKQGERPLV